MTVQSTKAPGHLKNEGVLREGKVCSVMRSEVYVSDHESSNVCKQQKTLGQPMGEITKFSSR